MIQWVYEGTLGCPRLSEVYIATCDVEIRDVARSFGAPVVMTSERHERASDRVAEVAEHLDADVVVMVQDDEPMVVPEMVTLATEPFATPGVLCTNLASVIESEEEFHDPNTHQGRVQPKGRSLVLFEGTRSHLHAWKVSVGRRISTGVRDWLSSPVSAALRHSRADRL